MEAAGNAVLRSEWSFQPLIDELRRLVRQFDDEPSLFEPSQLRQRLEALDVLDAYLPDAYFPDAYFTDAHFPDTPQSAPGVEADEAGLYRRARAICNRLEAVNPALYEEIRRAIQRGAGADALLRWVHSAGEMGEAGEQTGGMGYDFLDELVSGVLQFEEPDAEAVPREPEMVFYQPTPARHIFNMIGLAALTASDVLVDLGSGLGHVPLLVSICSDARSIGIELEATYVERARQCAQRLKLDRATFLQQDVRRADLSGGTVFYLYTPFTGSILRSVLDLLRREAASRRIRICSYGPCTRVLAEEPWLAAAAAPAMDRVAVFSSRD